jgi:hypothetical protein
MQKIDNRNNPGVMKLPVNVHLELEALHKLPLGQQGLWENPANIVAPLRTLEAQLHNRKGALPDRAADLVRLNLRRNLNVRKLGHPRLRSPLAFSEKIKPVNPDWTLTPGRGAGRRNPAVK